MPDPSKTVFISYRRSVSWSTARLIFLHLREHGYDVFMDVESIDSGTFDTIILRQIAARAHFLIILESSALDRCNQPGDWLRREIEYAIEKERNIVPVMVEGFQFGSPVLKGKLAKLPRYNALRLPHDYFDAAMEKLRTRFLQQPVTGQIVPAPPADQPAVEQKLAQVVQGTGSELSANEYFERGNARKDKGDLDGAIADYTEALRLNPQLATVYNNRGAARYDKGNLDGAMADFNEALRINPQDALAYNNRGIAHLNKGDLDRGLADFNEVLRLTPQNAAVYYNRGTARADKGDLDGAIADYNEALHLNPQLMYAYVGRATTRYNQGDLDGAITDFNEALRLNPQYATAYYNRGWVYEQKGDHQAALADYEAALRIDPDHELARNNRDNLLKKMGR